MKKKRIFKLALFLFIAVKDAILGFFNTKLKSVFCVQEIIQVGHERSIRLG